LDTALRRRFAFREIAPDANYISSLPPVGQGIDLRPLFEALNERLEFLYDREHRIGHGYFKPLEDPALDETGRFAVLGEIFRTSIIPLLAEYFFDDWSRIALVLGDDSKEPDHRFLEHRETGRWTVQGSELHDSAGGKGIWRIRDEAFRDPEAYRGIYA
jgi:5-methylcytosine-specific restriction protein B